MAEPSRVLVEPLLVEVNAKAVALSTARRGGKCVTHLYLLIGLVSTLLLSFVLRIRGGNESLAVQPLTINLASHLPLNNRHQALPTVFKRFEWFRSPPALSAAKREFANADDLGSPHVEQKHGRRKTPVEAADFDSKSFPLLEHLRELIDDPDFQDHAKHVADEIQASVVNPELREDMNRAAEQLNMVMADPNFKSEVNRVAKQLNTSGDLAACSMMDQVESRQDERHKQFKVEDVASQSTALAEHIRALINNPKAQRVIEEVKANWADPNFRTEAFRVAEHMKTVMTDSNFQEEVEHLAEQTKLGVSNPNGRIQMAKALEALATLSGVSDVADASDPLGSEMRTSAQTRPRLLVSRASKQKQEEGSGASGGVSAAGALASSAVIAEAIQIGGTAVLLYLGQKYTGTDSPVDAVATMIDYIKSLGTAGYGVFGVAMVFFQVVPIAAAFVLTVSAGAIFGAVKGTVTVLTCSTVSAMISFFIGRSIGRDRLVKTVQGSKDLMAIDKALETASFIKSLTLITLLRLSPVLPFAWANYAFGLTPVAPAAFSIGTFVGCAPNVAAYVSAGQVGADVAVNGVPENPALLVVGALATLGAITSAGNIATGAIQELEAEEEAKR